MALNLPTPPPSPTPSAPDDESDLRYLLSGGRGGKGGKGAPRSTGRGGKGGPGPARPERSVADSRPYAPRSGKGGVGLAQRGKGKGRPPGLADEPPQVGGPGSDAQHKAGPQNVVPTEGGYEITLFGPCAGCFEDDKLRVPSHMRDLMEKLADQPPTAIQKNRSEDDRSFRLRLLKDTIQPRTFYLLEFLTQAHIHESEHFPLILSVSAHQQLHPPREDELYPSAILAYWLIQWRAKLRRLRHRFAQHSAATLEYLKTTETVFNKAWANLAIRQPPSSVNGSWVLNYARGVSALVKLAQFVCSHQDELDAHQLGSEDALEWKKVLAGIPAFAPNAMAVDYHAAGPGQASDGSAMEVDMDGMSAASSAPPPVAPPAPVQRSANQLRKSPAIAQREPGYADRGATRRDRPTRTRQGPPAPGHCAQERINHFSFQLWPSHTSQLGIGTFDISNLATTLINHFGYGIVNGAWECMAGFQLALQSSKYEGSQPGVKVIATFQSGEALDAYLVQQVDRETGWLKINAASLEYRLGWQSAGLGLMSGDGQTTHWFLASKLVYEFVLSGGGPAVIAPDVQQSQAAQLEEFRNRRAAAQRDSTASARVFRHSHTAPTPEPQSPIPQPPDRPRPVDLGDTALRVGPPAAKRTACSSCTHECAHSTTMLQNKWLLGGKVPGPKSELCGNSPHTRKPLRTLAPPSGCVWNGSRLRSS